MKDLVDVRGNPLVVEKTAPCGDGLQHRGPTFGIGELGGIHMMDPLDSTGFQRNLERLGGWGSSAAVFGCVNVIAQAMATLERHHVRKLDNGGFVRISTSALSRILRIPNAYQSPSDFMMNLLFGLLYTGNAYALALRNAKNEVDSLHLMPPLSTEPYIDYETGEIFYSLGENPLLPEYTYNDLRYLVPARDVLHIKLYTPRHPLIGVSPIRYASMAININTSIAGNQAAFFNNMSRPSGVLTTDNQLTKEQMGALREAWEERSRGMNAGGIPILGWGMKWQPMTITSEDAQLIEAYRMSIEDIARVFRVPLALLGDYTKATYANTEQLISAWLSTGLGFMIEHVENSLEKFFRLPADEFVEFDVNALLRTDFQGRMQAFSTAATSGIMSPNEIRAREGLPAVEFGDEPRVQAQNLPLSAVGKMPDTPPVPDVPATPVSDPNSTDGAVTEAIAAMRKLFDDERAEEKRLDAEREKHLEAERKALYEKMERALQHDEDTEYSEYVARQAIRKAMAA